MIFHDYSLTEGEIVSTKSENLVNEFKSIIAKIEKIDKFGGYWIRILKGNTSHKKGELLMFSKHHLRVEQEKDFNLSKLRCNRDGTCVNWHYHEKDVKVLIKILQSYLKPNGYIKIPKERFDKILGKGLRKKQ